MALRSGKASGRTLVEPNGHGNGTKPDLQPPRALDHCAKPCNRSGLAPGKQAKYENDEKGDGPGEPGNANAHAPEALAPQAEDANRCRNEGRNCTDVDDPERLLHAGRWPFRVDALTVDME